MFAYTKILIRKRKTITVQHDRDYILESQKCLLTFNKVIDLLKIESISNPAEADIDLSLTKITKETFVNLLVKPKQEIEKTITHS